MADQPTSAIELYQTSDGLIKIDVRTDGDTVWLTRQQLALLFDRDVKTIGKHIGNAVREELADLATVAKFATVQVEGDRSVKRQVEHYNLDMVLSVGYRVKSSEGIRFRRWANGVLKDYLVKGMALNDRRLEQLGSIVRVLSRSDNELISGVADVLAGYVPGLRLLREYDDGYIAVPEGAAPGWDLSLAEARSVVARVASEFPDDTLVGLDPGNKLASSIAAIYQSFEGHDIYPSVELKAANLLYFVVKDHPLVDGNKRSAAALFVTFLARNGLLINTDGQPKFTNNALAALTLMVAMSDPTEKDLMVALISKMIAAN
ncbi:MAG TPA: virulence protein RhuM/Fic/DOC family protein [Acidimicrobiales bacterium]|nr:virulence protein RhuM/Fic/DOC family protein [Acidimicrobiales bacterium]